jgi:two-component system cell cycle sensor histidine kinase/response regulator CckA
LKGIAHISPLLLVEDDIVDAGMVRRVLPSGIEVVSVDTVAGARAAMARRPFRCALIDLALPDGDGRMVLAACRSVDPPVPVVVLTAMSSTLMAEVLLTEGAQDYLMKEELDRTRLQRALTNAVTRGEAELRRRRLAEWKARARELDRLAELAGGIGEALLDRLQGIEINTTFLSGTPESASLATEVGTAAQECSELCRRLLLFARPEIQPGVTDVGQLLEATRRRWLHRLPPGVELGQEFGPLPTLRADEEALAIALDRLLENAVDAVGPAGRVWLRAELFESPDPIGSPFGLMAGAGRFVRIEVADDGVGIAPKDLPRVCDPFFTRREGGLGLGLSLVLAITRAHGGIIDIDSAPGETQVNLYLPVPERRLRA